MRIRAALLFTLPCGLLFGAPIHAQSSKSVLNAQIQQDFPDNVTGFITPFDMRLFLGNLIPSFQQYLGVNAQVGTSYTIQASDYGQLVTFNNAGAVSVTLPGAGAAGFWPFNFIATNLGSGAVTITPTIGTINGAPFLRLITGQGATIVSDGTNWQVYTTAGGVVSFNGRSGVVVPLVGDYSTSQLTINGSGTFPACTSGILGARCSVQTLNSTGTAVFTNGSANIGVASNTPQFGAVVIFATSGSLPTNFATSTNYYVVSVVGTTIQVAATPDGTPIVAGSSGSGTQTLGNAAILSTGVVHDVGYLDLPAGLWNCSGNVGFKADTTTTVAFEVGGIGVASNTALNPGFQGNFTSPGPITTGSSAAYATGDFHTSGPSKVFLYAAASFGTSFMDAYGMLKCLTVD